VASVMKPFAWTVRYLFTKFCTRVLAVQQILERTKNTDLETILNNLKVISKVISKY